MPTPYTTADVYTPGMTITAGAPSSTEPPVDELVDLGIVEFRANMGHMIMEAYFRGTPFGVTRNGRRVGVFVPAELWKKLNGRADEHPGPPAAA